MTDEAHLSAEPACPGPPSRLPGPLGDPRWPQGSGGAPGARPQEAVGLNHLRARKDFLAANHGARVATPGFVLLVNRREDGDSAMRVGFTATRKLGGAVIRNRAKRRFRALAAELLPASGIVGADHVLIVRGDGVERPHALLRDELHAALARVAAGKADRARGPRPRGERAASRP